MITIIDQPYRYTPVGQKLIVLCRSTNSGNDGFRYVYDFGDFTINVQPNPSGNGILDLMPIYREQVKNTGLHNSLGLNTQALTTISCTIREGWLVDGVFTISGSGSATMDSVNVFNAEYQIADGYKPNPSTRYGCNNDSKYLMSHVNEFTYEKDSLFNPARTIIIPTTLNDWGIIYFPSATSDLINTIENFTYQLIDSNGTIITTYNASVVNNESYSMNFGIYPQNLIANGVDLTSIKYIRFYLSDDDYDACSKLYVLKIVDSDCVFDNVRLGWANQVGGYDYFNFTKKSELTYNYDRKQYQKVIGDYGSTSFGFNTYDRGLTERQVITTKGLSITSDWIGKGAFELLNTLQRSNDVFVINSDGTQTPVLIDASNFVVKDERRSKLWNVTLNLKYSQPVGI